MRDGLNETCFVKGDEDEDEDEASAEADIEASVGDCGQRQRVRGKGSSGSPLAEAFGSPTVTWRDLASPTSRGLQWFSST